MKDLSTETVIVGGGLAGLTCAVSLTQSGSPFLLLESSDRVGGRVRSDIVDGFTLDRGYQIFLTAYPEAREILDYDALDLKPFYPGALVRCQGRFFKLSDPWQNPIEAMKTFLSPVGKPGDKVRIATARTRALMMSIQELWGQPDSTTDDALKAMGFSEDMIGKFLRPFLSGIFLEKDLRTSRKMFDFVFRMLALGNNTLPAAGMGAIPAQLASRLDPQSLRLSSPVERVDEGTVQLRSGQIITCRNTVLATEEPAARALLGAPGPTSFCSTTTVYFSAESPPFTEPIIAINGEGSGLVANVSVQSNVAPSYAPPGKSLVAASIVGSPDLSDIELSREVLKQLAGWFGKSALSWRHLKTYRIKYALPDQSPEAIEQRKQWSQGIKDVIVCGDHTESGSINGAMAAGRKAAEQIVAKQKALA